MAALTLDHARRISVSRLQGERLTGRVAEQTLYLALVHTCLTLNRDSRPPCVQLIDFGVSRVMISSATTFVGEARGGLGLRV
eukprot:4607488-Pyramimonas_sp.AAC.1